MRNNTQTSPGNSWQTPSLEGLDTKTHQYKFKQHQNEKCCQSQSHCWTHKDTQTLLLLCDARWITSLFYHKVLFKRSLNVSNSNFLQKQENRSCCDPQWTKRCHWMITKRPNSQVYVGLWHETALQILGTSVGFPALWSFSLSRLMS